MSEHIKVVIDDRTAGMRVDKCLSQLVDQRWSRSCIQTAIENGGLCVNGIAISDIRYKTKIGDECALFIEDHKPIKLIPCAGSLDILFEDDDIIVLNKPEGQVVHLGNGIEPGSTLVEALLAYCPLSSAAGALRPGVVHRLDQATSGVILFAKTDLAYWALTRMFSERAIHKTYHALVWGIPHHLSGCINAPIGRSQRDRTAMCVRHDGREACTQWHILKKFPEKNKTLLACLPISGRTHQIRVHLKHMGHPIVGDPKYGKIPDVRLFLHAYKIEFEHPVSHQYCSFIAPWPESFTQTIDYSPEHDSSH